MIIESKTIHPVEKQPKKSGSKWHWINSHDLITDYLVILPSIFNIFQIKYLGEFNAYLQNTLQLIILFTLIASQWDNVLVCCGKILQNTCEHFKKVKGKSCLYSKTFLDRWPHCQSTYNQYISRHCARQ